MSNCKIPCSIDRLFSLYFVSDDWVLFSKKTKRPVGFLDKKGYLRVKPSSVQTKAHRIIYAMHHGRWPDGDIDHIDSNRANNNPVNLRDVSSSVNNQNVRNKYKTNTTGYLGVQFRQGRYIAQLNYFGTKIYVGSFSSAELAHEAYIEAKRKHHEGNTL